MIKRYRISDRKMQALCAAACDAKGFVWNIFFGWRRTVSNKDGDIMEFLLSTKLYKCLLDNYHYYFS